MMRLITLFCAAVLAGPTLAQNFDGPRPVMRVIEPPMRPIARRVEQQTPIVTLSTMSAPPIRTRAAIADLPLLGTAHGPGYHWQFLPPVLPLREQITEAVATVSAPLRPALRPEREIVAQPALLIDPEEPLLVGQEAAGQVRPEFSVLAVALALRPPERPEGITRAAMALAEERRRGSVCGDPAIQGVSRGTVPGPGSCGIAGAVEVRSVAGVRLSAPAVIDCQTATTLRRWVENSAIPQFRDAGGLAEIHVMGAYSCRTRNNAAGARLSEHSFGRAIDIGGFVLRDGSRVSVLRGWNSSWGQRLRQMHSDACGPFGTVLGPNANAAHRDHFHFDTARYRSGSYCR